MSQLSISAREAMNRFLIEDFNYILRAEEKALSAYGGAGLSVNEFHIIESVLRAEKEEQNTMGEISRRLGVTMGTLTTAVKTLEKKGCLLRRRSVEDKRVVRLEATDKGKDADQYHQRFHTAMVEAVAGCLSEEQLVTLTGALSLLAGYFSHYSHGRGDFSSEGEREPWLSPQVLGGNAEQTKEKRPEKSLQRPGTLKQDAVGEAGERTGDILQSHTDKRRRKEVLYIWCTF